MKNLLTEKDIIQSPFFQLPKDLFHSLAYCSMRLESKVAYTILLDLLPLSIQNRWVNEKGEVFVKLSRKKLMALLGIKGTQKMAQVMKELEDRQLIVNKRVGLTKCNEIYLYPVDSAILVKQDPKPQDFKKKNHHKAQIAQVPTLPAAKENKQKEPQETKSNQTRFQETPKPTHLVDTMDTTEILNPKRYLQTMIYNSIHEANTRMLGHIRYHFGYC